MGTVLVLDDDDAIVELLASVLRDAGHTTLGARAVEEVPEGVRPDVVLSDLITVKPYETNAARAWIARLRARFEAPIVIVTAHRRASDEGTALGADAVLAKPFDVEELLGLVARYVVD